MVPLRLAIVLLSLLSSACSWMPKFASARTAPKSAPHAAPLSPQAIFQRANDALVMVIVKTHDGTSQGTGAVVGLVGGYQVILTCAHLFEEAEGPIMLLVYDGRSGGTATSGALLVADADADLALVTVTGPLPTRMPLRLAPHLPGLFAPVYMLGHPAGAPRTASPAVVDSVARQQGTYRVMQMSGFCWPGMSGGPVLDADGALVGVIRSVHAATNIHGAPDEEGNLPDVVVPDICYAVRLDALQKFISKAGVQ